METENNLYSVSMYNSDLMLDQLFPQIKGDFTVFTEINFQKGGYMILYKHDENHNNGVFCGSRNNK